MSTLLSRGCSISAHRAVVRGLAFVAAFFVPTLLSAETIWMQDFLHQDREMARTWTLHRIAAIQAVNGDIEGAKNTVAQIGDADVIPESAEATRAGFSTAQPPCNAPAATSRSDRSGSLIFLKRNRAPEHVPTAVPQGLPANYFTADPRHGALVNFSDERDGSGTRVTSRRYADGYIVIETPKAVR
jgi:hypothetical protein